MSDKKKKESLKAFLEEVINWNWAEFVDAEKNRSKFTGQQSVILALVRNCAEGKLDSIKLTLDRMDGKVATPVEIEYPKMYFIYPNATEVGPPPDGFLGAGLSATDETAPSDDDEEPEETAATMTLRETLQKLIGYPRDVTEVILKKREEVDYKWTEYLDKKKPSPLVKSVVAANLVRLAENKNYNAITEIFDRIDGKLVEKIKVIGQDVYVTQYSKIAPFSATKNKDGVYVYEAKELQSQWVDKLKEHKNL